MATRYSSRGPEIDTDKCVKLTNQNRFQLVLVAAARAREIKREAVKNGNYTMLPIVSALLEIQEGKVDANAYLNKLR
jgi:DNA-directed RNA polymerase omega subunit